MNKNDRRIFTLAEEKPVKAVIKMGVSLTMGMMFMAVYNLADTFFIGLLRDDYQLAATNLSYPVMMLMVALSAIVASGAASYISRCMGKQDMDNAKRTLTTGFVMIIVFGFIIAAGGLIFIDPIVQLLGADETTASFTKQYTVILFIGTFFMMGNYTFGQLLRSEGAVMPSMIGMIAGTVINIILDPVFIFLFGLGVRGAAIATVIGNAAAVCIFVFYYVSGRTILKPSLKYIKPDVKIVKEIMWVGFPHMLEQFMTVAAAVVLNNLVACYGGLAVAATGVASKLMSFGSYIYQGMTAGCQPILGYCYGAENHMRLKAVIKSGIKVTTLIEIVVMILFMILAPFLMKLFTDSPEVVDLGTKALRAMVLIFPFVCTTSIVRNTYSAMGRPVPSFILTVIRQAGLYIPVMVLFSSIGGFDLLVFSQPVSEFISMIIAAVMLRVTVNKFDKSMHINTQQFFI